MGVVQDLDGVAVEDRDDGISEARKGALAKPECKEEREETAHELGWLLRPRTRGLPNRNG
jgi:hypothetical protein